MLPVDNKSWSQTTKRKHTHARAHTHAHTHAMFLHAYIDFVLYRDLSRTAREASHKASHMSGLVLMARI